MFRTYKRQKEEGLDDQTISRFRKMIKVLSSAVVWVWVCACVCACVCVRACVCVCVRACVGVCVRAYQRCVPYMCLDVM